MIFERKIYNKLLEWKKLNGSRALLIEGARRVGKSTIVEEFGKREYRSYVLIDFGKCSQNVKSAFENYLSDLNSLFSVLAFESKKELFERDTLFIFDEVQKFPRAREAIKYLVKDGRFDYIETGSLISIKENVQDIIIPSEERRIKMYPLDFEEFCWALGEDKLLAYIRECFNDHKPLLPEIHKKAMLVFREYLIIGGMPQSVSAYLEKPIRNIKEADSEKKDILALYRSDIMKIKELYRNKVISIFDNIPGILSQHEKRVVLNDIEKKSGFADFESTFFYLEDSMITNICFNSTDPNVGLALNEDRTLVKCYMSDTGLLVSHTFSDNVESDERTLSEILAGKLSVNEGMFFENLIAQMLVASGHRLFFYNHYNNVSKRNDIEIDFLISDGSKTKTKIFPIEVKSSDNYSYKSLLRFKELYSRRIGGCYLIHPKNYSEKDGIIFLPCYMAFLL